MNLKQTPHDVAKNYVSKILLDRNEVLSVCMSKGELLYTLRLLERESVEGQVCF